MTPHHRGSTAPAEGSSSRLHPRQQLPAASPAAAGHHCRTRRPRLPLVRHRPFGPGCGRSSYWQSGGPLVRAASADARAALPARPTQTGSGCPLGGALPQSQRRAGSASGSVAAPAAGQQLKAEGNTSSAAAPAPHPPVRHAPAHAAGLGTALGRFVHAAQQPAAAAALLMLPALRGRPGKLRVWLAIVPLAPCWALRHITDVIRVASPRITQRLYAIASQPIAASGQHGLRQLPAAPRHTGSSMQRHAPAHAAGLGTALGAVTAPACRRPRHPARYGQAAAYHRPGQPSRPRQAHSKPATVQAGHKSNLDGRPSRWWCATMQGKPQSGHPAPDTKSPSPVISNPERGFCRQPLQRRRWPASTMQAPKTARE